jgi:hypothetical protein
VRTLADRLRGLLSLSQVSRILLRRSAMGFSVAPTLQALGAQARLVAAAPGPPHLLGRTRRAPCKARGSDITLQVIFQLPNQGGAPSSPL